MNEVLSYLQKRGVSYKPEGKEVVIDCPVCGKKKLFINLETQLYQCWYCKAKNPTAWTVKGHLSKIKEYWGDIISVAPLVKHTDQNKEKKDVDFTEMAERYHYELMQNLAAKKYLVKRKFSLEDIKENMFGFVRQYGQNWISIPSSKDGIVKLIKYRKLPPEENTELGKYIREPGGESILWNEDVLDEYNEIIVAEGEIDAATLVREGYENVVGPTVGAGTLEPAWYDKLVLKERIYLVLDADSAGQIAARDVWATRLGIDKCYNVVLPEGEDVNSYFMSHTKEEFDLLLKSAKRFEVSGVVSVTDALVDLYEQSEFGDSLDIYPLPWDSINSTIGGGLVKKRLLVLGGQGGSGKTSMVMQIVYHFATEYEIPVFVFCLEMPETDLAKKVVQLHKDISFKEFNASDALVYATEIADIPIYFGYSSAITLDVFRNTMQEVRNRYGVTLGIFDNLQLLVRSDKESDIGIASRGFKNMVMDLNIMFILISQPRKQNADVLPTMQDLKGSVTIHQDADTVLLLHRKRMKGAQDGAYEPLTYVINDKSRYASGGIRKLLFIGEKSKFVEI